MSTPTPLPNPIALIPKHQLSSLTPSSSWPSQPPAPLIGRIALAPSSPLLPSPPSPNSPLLASDSLPLAPNSFSPVFGSVGPNRSPRFNPKRPEGGEGETVYLEDPNIGNFYSDRNFCSIAFLLIFFKKFLNYPPLLLSSPPFPLSLPPPPISSLAPPPFPSSAPCLPPLFPSPPRLLLLPQYPLLPGTGPLSVSPQPSFPPHSPAPGCPSPLGIVPPNRAERRAFCSALFGQTKALYSVWLIMSNKMVFVRPNGTEQRPSVWSYLAKWGASAGKKEETRAAPKRMLGKKEEMRRKGEEMGAAPERGKGKRRGKRCGEKRRG